MRHPISHLLPPLSLSLKKLNFIFTGTSSNLRLLKNKKWEMSVPQRKTTTTVVCRRGSETLNPSFPAPINLGEQKTQMSPQVSRFFSFYLGMKYHVLLFSKTRRRRRRRRRRRKRRKNNGLQGFK